VQAQLLRLPRDKELTHEKAVHGKTSNHLSPEKMERGVEAERAAAKDLWIYPQLGTELCPATAEFIIDDSVISTHPLSVGLCVRLRVSHLSLARHRCIGHDRPEAPLGEGTDRTICLRCPRSSARCIHGSQGQALVTIVGGGGCADLSGVVGRAGGEGGGPVLPIFASPDPRWDPRLGSPATLRQRSELAGRCRWPAF
jgi:hypothetical protein